ncbi:hypothetical protein GMRT_15178 [Giardia muris]|uniref:Uncharacterized protein n=1 Tax=Giardia muris TaxID=5742 RepID=A0A4Z1SQI4_GIAMU|nr:hypothetical protein GMRT_15178 [Giardia muris]|eukprot:TNJ28114.1 hypothetical protein GMRT_15178 [Giardia muris]
MSSEFIQTEEFQDTSEPILAENEFYCQTEFYMADLWSCLDGESCISEPVVGPGPQSSRSTNVPERRLVCVPQEARDKIIELKKTTTLSFREIAESLGLKTPTVKSIWRVYLYENRQTPRKGGGWSRPKPTRQTIQMRVNETILKRIVSMRDNGATIQMITDKLKEEFDFKISRSSVWNLLKRADADAAEAPGQ